MERLTDKGDGMFFSVVAHSEDIDEAEALCELIGQCKAELGGRSPQAALMFAGHEMDHAVLLAGICDTWPGIVLIGCTTDGELSSRLGLRLDSVALVLFGSDRIEFTAGIGRGLSEDVAGACSRAVDDATRQATKTPAICLAFPESLTSSGQAVVEALNDKLGGRTPVFGATSGDGYVLKRTFQFFGREVFEDSVPVLLLSGPLVYSAAAASGWEPMGEPGTVTRSENTVVYEIDGQPAAQFYQRFLGTGAIATPEFPLAILDARCGVESLRTPIGPHPTEKGAIIFFSEVREGVTVQISSADRTAILDGCTASIKRAFAGYPHGKTPQAAVVFSCSCRRLLLGTRTREECDVVGSVLGGGVPTIGFYGYGEIAPTGSSGGVSMYHNETFVSLILGT